MASAATSVDCADRHSLSKLESFWRMTNAGEVTRCVEPDDFAHGTSPDHRSPIHDAVMFADDAEVLKALLKMDGANPNARLNNGETPLHVLTSSQLSDARRADLFGILMENGANINARDLNGMTPLLTAAKNGDPAMVRKLIENGADLDAKNLDDEGVLVLALRSGRLGVALALVEAGRSVDSEPFTLMAALESGEADVARFVIENKEVIERRTNSTITVAHVIAKHGTGDAMRALKERGARLNIGFQTERPIHWAAYHNDDPEIIQVIVNQAGLNQVDVTNRMGLTPIMLAILNNPNPEVAQLLADLGADLSMKTKGGQTIYDLLMEREKNPKFNSLKSTKLYWDIHEGRF
ncbi:hypothetical protein DSM110093_04242 (plasmid) [Sulfitobacter sp. DSM 110093]|nr:hypothetical protein DSM110093_04242 [Sulfitobacter sp. DSM 110093]